MFLNEWIPILKTHQDVSVVENYLQQNIPAVVSSNIWLPVKNLHVSLDWDATVADDEADILVDTYGRAGFTEHEVANYNIPHGKGPMYGVLEYLQTLDNVTISIVTARKEEEMARVRTSLRTWKIYIDELIHVGEGSKGDAIAKLGAHIHIDDVIKHVHDVNRVGAYGLWLPYRKDLNKV